MIADWWRRNRSYRQRQCTHPVEQCDSIYGDAIIANGWKRGYCRACGLRLDALPAKRTS